MSSGLDSAAGSRRPRSIGLVVVHGIGEPTAGEALADFTDSLEDAELALFEPTPRLQRLVAPAESAPTKRAFFPVHLREGQATGDHAPIIAAEVYWGSASQLAPGRLGVVHGIISLMLNVPALIAGADERATGTRGAIHKQAWFASMLLAGPAFALNALLLATLAGHLAIHYLFEAPGSLAEAFVPLLAIAATVALGFLPWLWFPETKWSFWLVGPASLAVSAAIHRSIDVQRFANSTVLMLEWLIGATVALLLLLIGTYVVGRVTHRVSRTSLTALLAVCLQFGIWAAFVPLTWRIILKWMPPRAHEPWMTELFQRAARSDGLQWMMTGVVMLALAVVVARREISSRRYGQIAPRLIVNRLVTLAIIAVTALGAVVILYATVGTTPAWMNWLYARIPQTHGTTALVLIFPFVVKPIRLGLDLAHDVISYIYYDCERGRAVLSRRRVERKPTPVRSRFRHVIEYLVTQRGVERLIVVAHSQGSVIALDELTHSWDTKYLPKGISFVTVGSPISHMYGYYFPNLYADWNQAKWNAFFERVARWGNFYRLGDYVGATIDRPTKCDFTETSLGAGSHTGYFRDPRFIEALRNWDLFADGRQRSPMALVKDAAS